MLAVLHVCPVCGRQHAVHPILDRLAYGCALTCSPRCKTLQPKLILARLHAGDGEQAPPNGAQ